MKKNTILSVLFLMLMAGTSYAQQTSIYNKNGYKLTFTNYDNTLDTALKTKLINTFYKVYPELAHAYNKKTLKAVIMIIDTNYKGVAETANGVVTISSRWMHQHPEDIDVVTHEVMHIVQDYGESTGPGWLTEGIADYARFKFGVNNPAANWSLPAYKASQNYDNSYRVTARFLAWLEKSKPGIVKTFDAKMRDHTFTDETWKQQTGKTLNELWKNYSENPTV